MILQPTCLPKEGFDTNTNEIETLLVGRFLLTAKGSNILLKFTAQLLAEPIGGLFRGVYARCVPVSISSYKNVY